MVFSNADWKFDDTGVMPRGKGNNLTKQSFGDARIHLEFRFEPSDNPEWKGQLYGNSGIFHYVETTLPCVRTIIIPREAKTLRMIATRTNIKTALLCKT